MQVAIQIKASHNLYESEFRSIKGLRKWLKGAVRDTLNEATTEYPPELYPGFRYDEGPVVQEITISLDRYIRDITSAAESEEEAREWEAAIAEVVTSGLCELSLQEAYEDILNPVESRVA